MEAERIRLVREVYFELKQYDAAGEYHQRYLKHLSSSGQRARAADAWGSRLSQRKSRHQPLTERVPKNRTAAQHKVSPLQLRGNDDP